MLPALVFQLEVYYKLDRLPTGLTAQQNGTTAQWYSNRTSLFCTKKRIDGLMIVKYEETICFCFIKGQFL